MDISSAYVRRKQGHALHDTDEETIPSKCLTVIAYRQLHASPSRIRAHLRVVDEPETNQQALV